MLLINLLATLFLTWAIPTQAASVPPGFTDAVIATGITWPTTIAVADDGRVFVAEQGGALRVVTSSGLQAQPFLVLQVQGQGGAANEAGLVGAVLSPNFATNRHIFLYYTAPAQSGVASHNRISRFTASAANPNVVEAGSERIIFDIPGPSAGAHNSGALHFGADGKLYVAVGDHSASSNGQSMTTVKGKILRINEDGSIPTDNPFFTTTTGINRAIWALGFRNPFRTAVQRTTGRIFVNDVGNGRWEEINDLVKGGNYGWTIAEGPSTDPRFVNPLFAYSHQTGPFTGCAIVGGSFYDSVNLQFPSTYHGKYFFADYCQDWIRMLDPATNQVTVFATGLDAAVDIQVGNNGALYYLERNKGLLRRVTYQGAFPAPPNITTQPVDQTVAESTNVTFNVSVEGTPPLTYQWFRNGNAISGATTQTLSFDATAADSGAKYKVTVSNSVGSALSREALLTVLSESDRPSAEIISAPTQYRAGDTIVYTGQGFDGQGNSLPASALKWDVEFHHDQHTHPVDLGHNGFGGQFSVSQTEHKENANVFFRVRLTATASNGLTRTVFADVMPLVATILIDTFPQGLTIQVDGPPMTTPVAIQSVVGMRHVLEAAPYQTFEGQNYVFNGWDQGGQATQTITTPEADSVYRAQYVASAGLSEYNDSFDAFGPPWVQIVGEFFASNGELRNKTLPAMTFQTAWIPTFQGSNMVVSADFARIGDKSPKHGLLLRVQDTKNYYLFYRLSGSSSRVVIAKVVNGVETTLASTNIPNSVRNVLYKMEAKANGSTLTLFIDGLFKISASDTTFTGGGVGIGMGSLSGTPADSDRADNFSAVVTD